MAIFGGTSLGGITGGATTARLLVVVSGQTSQLESSLAAATASLEGFKTNANALGNSLIRGLTLPTLALGGAAIKMAADYQTAIARVAGLTNASAAQVTQAYNHILDVAQKIPTAPTELANALYFAASAGLQFGTAMQVVELSAKGAAIGMGDAADISKVLIFALNTFGKSGLTAAHAMDVLAAGIREGTAEPDEMALALGRLLPIAREAGISFDNVVASVAQLSNLGLPVRVATTSLRALFQELLAPTQRANSELRALGITADQLRTALEAGPIVAFKLLTDATNGNIDAIHAVIPQIRGLTAFLGLTGDNAKNLNTVFNKVRNSTGTLERAFAIMSNTLQFRFNIALNQMRVAAIKVGTALFPVFSGLINVLGKTADALSGMGPAGAAAAAAFLTVAAAIGPVIKLIAVMGSIGTSVLGTVKGLSVGLTLFAASAAIAFTSINSLAHGNTTLAGTFVALTSSFVAARIGLQLLTVAASQGMLGADAKLLSTLIGLGNYATAAAAAFAVLAIGIAIVIGNSHHLAVEANNMANALVDAGAGAATTNRFFDQLSDTKLANTLRQVASAAKTLGQPLGTTFNKNINTSNAELTKLVAGIVKFKSSADGMVGAGVGLKPFLAALTAAAGKGQSASQAFKAAGLSTEDFDKAIAKAGMNSTVTGEKMRRLVVASDALATARHRIADATAAQLVLDSQSDAKIQEIASTYGVSVDQVKSKADELGVSVVGLSGDTEQSFAQQAGFVKNAAGQIESTLDDLMKTYQQAADNAIKSFDPFADAPKKLNKSLAQITKGFEENIHSFSTVVKDEAILLQRGLSPDLVAKIAAGGADMTEKFVHASDKELGKLQALWNKHLEDNDAQVILEGEKLQGKGKNNILKFAAGMQASLPNATAAANRIINAVAIQVQSGNFPAKGYDVVQHFAAGMFGAEHIPKDVAEKIVIQFVNALAAGDFDGTGSKNIEEFARGIAKKYKLPVSEAQAIALGVKAALHTDATGVGYDISKSLAAGLDAGGMYAIQAAKALAGRVRSALVDGSKGSPMYFTYYMGRDFVKQLSQGLADEPLRARTFKPAVAVNPLAGVSSSGGGPSYNLHFHGDIYGFDDFANRVDSAITQIVRSKS